MKNGNTEYLRLQKKRASAVPDCFSLSTGILFNAFLRNPWRMQFVDVVVGVLFAIVVVAVVGYIGLIIPELQGYSKQNARLASILSLVFNAAPAQGDSKKTVLPVRVTMEGLIPVIFWLLILLPMFIFPIVLIIFPIMGIPWSYLLPPVP